MKSLLSIGILALASKLAVAQDDCPDIPENDVEIGEPVPMNPDHIPDGCSAYEILVARGTSEPNYEEGDGKFGFIVGDPIVSNVTEILPDARGYPVQYPASARIISGTRQGKEDVIQRLESQSAACPDQTFSLVGYSQGAGVMHAAAGDLPEQLYPKIKSIVMFGDPMLKLGSRGEFPEGLQEKVLQNCADGDPTCDSGTCAYWHLTYIRPEYINPSVEFIVNAFTDGAEGDVPIDNGTVTAV